MATTLPLFRLSHPLSRPDLVTYKNALQNLQGNVLKSHGREAALHIFLTFQDYPPDRAKRFLSSLIPELTSAAEQRAQTLRNKHGNELFTALYLSAKGYQHLEHAQGGFSNRFWRGMRAAKLGDLSPGEWEPPFQRDLHAMVLLAHDDMEELKRQRNQLEAKVRGFAHISVEVGRSMGTPKKTFEHFGYMDGVSQPLFYQSDVKGATNQWDPSAGPNLVLIRDPYGRSDEDCGTYFVFRKLEQNVRGFQEHAEQLAEKLQAGDSSLELARAQLVGRFRDGTPVALYPESRKKPENNFRYSLTDRDGNRCPFSAHIRKTNPRGESGEALSKEKSHRIARRGISYGDPIPDWTDPKELPETGVGLLFQCCQADLSNQFEFLQRSWAGNASFHKPGSGKDPIIGLPSDGSSRRLRFPDRWGNSGRVVFGFHSFITLKGGEYFFAPSITFLKHLHS
jgi:Dyp-type peroxidase family